MGAPDAARSVDIISACACVRSAGSSQNSAALWLNPVHSINGRSTLLHGTPMRYLWPHSALDSGAMGLLSSASALPRLAILAVSAVCRTHWKSSDRPTASQAAATLAL